MPNVMLIVFWLIFGVAFPIVFLCFLKLIFKGKTYVIDIKKPEKLKKVLDDLRKDLSL